MLGVGNWYVPRKSGIRVCTRALEWLITVARARAGGGGGGGVRGSHRTVPALREDSSD